MEKWTRHAHLKSYWTEVMLTNTLKRKNKRRKVSSSGFELYDINESYAFQIHWIFSCYLNQANVSKSRDTVNYVMDRNTTHSSLRITRGMQKNIDAAAKKNTTKHLDDDADQTPMTNLVRSQADLERVMNRVSIENSTNSPSRITRGMQKKIDAAGKKDAQTHLSDYTISKPATIVPKKVNFEPMPNNKRRKIGDDKKIHTFSLPNSSQAIRHKNKGQPKPVNALMQTFKKYDLVWARVRGFCHWPGVIEDLLQNGKYRIHFFGDYSRADVTRKNIVNYFEGFNDFSCNFGRVHLQKAVKEASFFMFNNGTGRVCYVCNVLDFKEKKMLNK